MLKAWIVVPVDFSSALTWKVKQNLPHYLNKIQFIHAYLHFTFFSKDDSNIDDTNNIFETKRSPEVQTVDSMPMTRRTCIATSLSWISIAGGVHSSMVPWCLLPRPLQEQHYTVSVIAIGARARGFSKGFEIARHVWEIVWNSFFGLQTANPPPKLVI